MAQTGLGFNVFTIAIPLTELERFEFTDELKEYTGEAMKIDGAP